MAKILFFLVATCHLLFAVSIQEHHSSYNLSGLQAHRSVKQIPIFNSLTNKDDARIINIQESFKLAALDTKHILPSAYSADKKEGLIGTTKKHPFDNPSDNTFHIYLPYTPSPDQQTYLQYDLFGVSNNTGIVRCINDGRALGGYFVCLNTKWTTQKEMIAITILHKGDNVIRFGLPLHAAYHYRIRSVFIVLVKKEAEQTAIIVNQPDKVYYGNRAYIKGVLKLPSAYQHSDSVWLFCNDELIRIYNNEFEAVIQKPAGSTKFSARLELLLPNNKYIRKTIDFTTDQKANFEYNSKVYTIKDDGWLVTDKIENIHRGQ